MKLSEEAKQLLSFRPMFKLFLQYMALSIGIMILLILVLMLKGSIQWIAQ